MIFPSKSPIEQRVRKVVSKVRFGTAGHSQMPQSISPIVRWVFRALIITLSQWLGNWIRVHKWEPSCAIQDTFGQSLSNSDIVRKQIVHSIVVYMVDSHVAVRKKDRWVSKVVVLTFTGMPVEQNLSSPPERASQRVAPFKPQPERKGVKKTPLTLSWVCKTDHVGDDWALRTAADSNSRHCLHEEPPCQSTK